MRLATALTCCAMAFSVPFAVGSEGLIEDRYWDVAGVSASAPALQSFVESFPESRFVTKAEQRIIDLRARAAVPVSGMSYVQ